jgi:hypothetical protein
VNIEQVCDRIRQDYATFPANQSYDLYADEVYFQDPLNRFIGIERYRHMIQFIARWFQSPQLVLHDLEIHSSKTFQTRWTLSWVAPLPWKPRLTVPGWTEYTLDDAGKITSHVDSWDMLPIFLLGQVFSRTR